MFEMAIGQARDSPALLIAAVVLLALTILLSIFWRD